MVTVLFDNICVQDEYISAGIVCNTADAGLLAVSPASCGGIENKAYNGKGSVLSLSACLMRIMVARSDTKINMITLLQELID